MSDKAIPICDPANCPTGKKVNKALFIMERFSNDIQEVKKDYKDGHKANEVLRETIIENTAQIANVVNNMEHDRKDWKEDKRELFDKVNNVAVGLANKASKDDVNKKIGLPGLMATVTIVGTLMGIVIYFK